MRSTWELVGRTLVLLTVAANVVGNAVFQFMNSNLGAYVLGQLDRDTSVELADLKKRMLGILLSAAALASLLAASFMRHVWPSNVLFMVGLVGLAGAVPLALDWSKEVYVPPALLAFQACMHGLAYALGMEG